MFSWRPYVSVAERRQKALKALEKMKKKGFIAEPITLNGKVIAKTFWGKSWCSQMESFGDFENRLPRGRTYVRNGSVLDLKIAPGQITALVNGSELYNINISINPINTQKWNEIKQKCTGFVSSSLELLTGKLNKAVMEVITHAHDGLFPLQSEINLNCSCPDYATMCKHVAAVLYGIGAKLDEQPELLFVLRGVNHNELITEAATKFVTHKSSSKKRLDDNIEALFGIDLEEEPEVKPKAKNKKITKK